MTKIIQQLQKFLKPYGKVKFEPVMSFCCFNELMPDFVQQLRADCERSWKTLSVFSDCEQPKFVCRCFQALLHRVHVDVFQQISYYQGIADLTELIVAQFVNFERIKDNFHKFQVSTDSFEVYNALPDEFFLDYSKCISTVYDIVDRYFINDLSSIQALQESAGQILLNLKELDAQIYSQLTQQQSESELKVQILQIIPSFCARQAKSLQLSVYLTANFLRLSKAKRNNLMAHILSLCARCACKIEPQQYKEFIEKIQYEDCNSQDPGWLIKSLKNIFGNGINGDILLDFIEFILQND